MLQLNEGREIWRVNAFTRHPFAGNPAGVVPEGEGLSDAQMQSIASELNDVSETVFILPADRGDADLRLRFFTSTTEVDLGGPATIAALLTLAWRGRITGTNEPHNIRAATPVGMLELDLEFAGGQPAWATMEQLAPSLAPAPGAAQAAEVLDGMPRPVASS